MYIRLDWVLLFLALMIFNALIGHGIAVGTGNSLLQAWLIYPILKLRPFAVDHAKVVA